MKMNDCIFCKIIKKEIPKDIVYEDKKTIVFLDIAPASKKGGHTLILPKKHYELISDVPEEDMKNIMQTIKKISKALMKFGEGLNIVQNNKKIAGQYVPHVHFHLIPRFEGDGITIDKWSMFKYKNIDEERSLVNKIKSLLKE